MTVDCKGYLAPKKDVFAEEARKGKVAFFANAEFLEVALSKDPMRCPRRGESRLQQLWYKECTLDRFVSKAKSVTVDFLGQILKIWGQNSEQSV